MQRTGHDSRRVQTRERDELDQEAGLAEVPNERLELLVGEAVRTPIERRRQVVDEPPARTKKTRTRRLFSMLMAR